MGWIWTLLAVWGTILKKKDKTIRISFGNPNIFKRGSLYSFTKSLFCFVGVLEHALTLSLGVSKIALFFT